MRISIVIVSLLALVGCASVDVYPVANDHGSKGKTLKTEESGVRFYRPAPHVWITSAAPSDKVDLSTVETTKDKTKTTSTVSTAGRAYSAQLVMLPDYSREFVVEWSAGIGNVNPAFTLEQGWNLTSFNAKVESKVAETIKETVGAITSLAPLAAGGMLAAQANFKGAGLYRLDVGPEGRLSLGALVLPLE